MNYDIEAIYRAYEQQHEDAAKRQGWTNEQMQRANYSTMCSMLTDVQVPLQGLSVHDVGCGYGDFYAYLQGQGGCNGYFGTDINAHSIARALSRFPKADFRTFDMTKAWPAEYVFDVTLVFGAFAFHKPRAVERLLHTMWERTKVALGFMSWWNLSKEYVYAEHAAQLQKVINRFLTTSRAPIVIRRVGDFAESTDALFLLVK